MAVKESLYKVAENAKNEVKNIGFNYQENLFFRTMSHILFTEDKRYAILQYIEKVMVELIDGVKKIKSHINYSVPKDYRDFN